ncbi:hypothetical protein L1887_49856 [Cichorium endivia]|nr:hypothetical protein L1887_49856 [Cichorium endivia]
MYSPRSAETLRDAKNTVGRLRSSGSIGSVQFVEGASEGVCARASRDEKDNAGRIASRAKRRRSIILPSAFQSASRRLETCTERNERRVYLLLCKDEVEIVWMYAIRVPSTARGGPSVGHEKDSAARQDGLRGLPSFWSTLLLHPFYPFYDLVLRCASSSVPTKPCPTLEYISALSHRIVPCMPFVTLDPAAGSRIASSPKE